MAEDRRRSFGVSFVSVMYILNALILMGTLICFLIPMLLHPGSWSSVFQWISSNPWGRTLGLYFDTTCSVAYLFVGFGLWQLKLWAYRLNLFLLLAAMIGKAGQLAHLFLMKISPFPYLWIQLAVLFLIFIFFRRGLIRSQFQAA